MTSMAPQSAPSIWATSMLLGFQTSEDPSQDELRKSLRCSAEHSCLEKSVVDLQKKAVRANHRCHVTAGGEREDDKGRSLERRAQQAGRDAMRSGW